MQYCLVFIFRYGCYFLFRFCVLFWFFVFLCLIHALLGASLGLLWLFLFFYVDELFLIVFFVFYSWYFRCVWHCSFLECFNHNYFFTYVFGVFWLYFGQWFVWSLFSCFMKHVSGQFCSLLCVCGHCALNFGFSSVIMCGLIGQWMNVNFLFLARLLFFLFGLLSFSLARFSPNLVFGFFLVILCWISSFLLYFFVILWLIFSCPGSVRVIIYIFR